MRGGRASRQGRTAMPASPSSLLSSSLFLFGMKRPIEDSINRVMTSRQVCGLGKVQQRGKDEREDREGDTAPIDLLCFLPTYYTWSAALVLIWLLASSQSKTTISKVTRLLSE